MDEIPILHVFFHGREELLRWFEQDAKDAGEDPEDHVVWLIETYREGVERRGGMTLTCSCSEYDGDPDPWCYFDPNDIKPFDRKRRKRCSSCGKLIDKGSPCLEFQRVRGPRTDIEERIYDLEVPLASLFFCQRCAEIYLNLTAAGYCFTPEDNMPEALEEYWELTGFDPDRYTKAQEV